MEIWKYPLKITDVQEIEAPQHYCPLSVQEQNGVLCLWMQVYPEEVKVKRKVWVVGTGNPVPKEIEESADYVGTAQTGPFVWHVFVEA